MTYRVLLHPRAARFLETTEPLLRQRIRARLKELEESPDEKGQRLKHTPFFRLRVGDYRAIYMIQEQDRRVIVLLVGHREEVYDDFSRLF